MTEEENAANAASDERLRQSRERLALLETEYAELSHRHTEVSARLVTAIRLGVTRVEIRRKFGEPDDVGGTSRQRRVPRIWKYGETELYFSGAGNLIMVFWKDGRGNSVAYDEHGFTLRHGSVVDSDAEERSGQGV